MLSPWSSRPRPLPAALVLAACVLAALGAPGCAQVQVRKTARSLDYLYPAGTGAQPARDVTLTLPVRVGLAFAPPPDGTDAPLPVQPTLFNASQHQQFLSEAERVQLLERIAGAFRGRPEIASIDVLPEAYLKPGGSWDNLDQLRQAFGIDLVVLVSYDQSRFSNTSNWSLTYLTIVGAYAVEGEDNQAHTLVDALVCDIRSRACLFRASGTSTLQEESTPVEVAAVATALGRRGFEEAVDGLVASLDTALSEFGRQAAEGHVRGIGTPAIEVRPSESYSGVSEFRDGRYVGALGPLEALAGLLLAAGAAVARRRR